MAKSCESLHKSHERLCKAHDDLHTAAKLHQKAHTQALLAGGVKTDDNLDRCAKAHFAKGESARLAGLDHRTIHKEHRDALTDAVESLQKLLGGGAATALAKPASEEPEPGLKADRVANMEKKFVAPFDILAAKVAASNTVKKAATRVPPNRQNPMYDGGVNQSQAGKRVHKSFFERQVEHALKPK